VVVVAVHAAGTCWIPVPGNGGAGVFLTLLAPQFKEQVVAVVRRILSSTGGAGGAAGGGAGGVSVGLLEEVNNKWQ
jgi:hypothetical protein